MPRPIKACSSALSGGEGQSAPEQKEWGQGFQEIKDMGRVKPLSQLPDGAWEPEGGVTAHG